MATTLENLGATWLLAKKVNFVPCLSPFKSIKIFHREHKVYCLERRCLNYSYQRLMKLGFSFLFPHTQIQKEHFFLFRDKRNRVLRLNSFCNFNVTNTGLKLRKLQGHTSATRDNNYLVSKQKKSNTYFQEKDYNCSLNVYSCY